MYSNISCCFYCWLLLPAFRCLAVCPRSSPKICFIITSIGLSCYIMRVYLCVFIVCCFMYVFVVHSAPRRSSRGTGRGRRRPAPQPIIITINQNNNNNNDNNNNDNSSSSSSSRSSRSSSSSSSNVINNNPYYFAAMTQRPPRGARPRRNPPMPAKNS